MSIVVFAEFADGAYKKSSLEALSAGRSIAEQNQETVIAVQMDGDVQADILAQHGAHKVVQASGNYGAFASHSWSQAFSQICQELGASLVLISNTYCGKSMAPRVAFQLKADMASNVVSMPKTDNGFSVKRGVFSGKAFAWVQLKSPVKVLALTPNSFEIKQWGGGADVQSITAQGESGIVVDSVQKVTGKIPLTEAEVVVSGGRGLKGPEHWGLIEDLAQNLGAATACSKPVSDMGWRPHSEHVGQTGITIKPNLYIAVGISGAIQHLAGVSSSKVIVAINKDPEAPFFKAADYGIVGDAFDVLPQLIAASK